MWCALENTIPTWDNLQNKIFEGSNWCNHCKENEEPITHIFINCAFVRSFWQDCLSQQGFNCIWNGKLMEVAL